MFRSRAPFRAVPAALLLALLAAPARAGLDVSGRLDANTIGFTFANVGFLGYDITTGSAGLEFPRGSGKFAHYAGGLWLGARVAGATRLAIADYASEFVPGPMSGGTFQPDRPEFHVYRVVASDTTGTADWMTYAVPQGAPTGAFGAEPAHYGDQTAWAVWNDANPSRHVSSSGGTAPLGVEVRQTAWASSSHTLENHAIFVRHRIVNRGANMLDSLVVGLWADPDLGGSGDDLVGSDSAAGMAYAYNATNNDLVYGTAPPAIGYVLLQGPGADPMPALSATAYINGTDPLSAAQTWQSLLGLHGDGTPWIDPGTGGATRFAYPGDPVTGTGWRDTGAGDKRLLLTTGPVPLAPGDSTDVEWAIVCAQSTDRLHSIQLLRSYVAILRGLVAVPAEGAASAHVALAPPANPARGPVDVRLVAPAGSAWELEVFDVRGRRVELAARGTGTGAAQAASWDPARAGAAPGVYWIVATANGERASRRVVVLAR